MITIEQAKQLKRDQIVYHMSKRNADGTPQRWRINGKPKIWKRNPDRVQIPVKHGLYSYDYLTQDDLHLVALTEAEAADPAADVA